MERRISLVFQWQPFHTGHGAKFWAHVTTKDFVEWKEEEIALAPGEWYDKTAVIPEAPSKRRAALPDVHRQCP